MTSTPIKMLMTVSKRFGVSCFKIKLSITTLWIDSSSELEQPQTLATNRNLGRLSVSSCCDMNHGDAFSFYVWCNFFACVRDLQQPQSSWETQKGREGQIEKLQLRVIRGHRREKADTLTSSGDLISSLEGGGGGGGGLPHCNPLFYKPAKQDKHTCSPLSTKY